MKAEITRDGTLRITPQSDLEAYALGKWTQAGKRKTRGPLEVLTEPEAQQTLTLSGWHPSSTGAGALVASPWPTTLGSSTTSDGMCP